ncbi:hypothetical protein LPJ57_004110, partial [Coemansia sp. RSA 486]
IKKDQHDGSFEVSELNNDGSDAVASEVLKHVLQQVSETAESKDDSKADDADNKAENDDSQQPSSKAAGIDPLADSPDPSVADAVKKSESEN